jgi:hypothetical protein
MEPPQGALRLVWQHVQEWKWTRTTSIVALYLVVNISGRLSVAIFGLTFNLAETLGIEYPIQRSNWSEPSSSKSYPHHIRDRFDIIANVSQWIACAITLRPEF